MRVGCKCPYCGEVTSVQTSGVRDNKIAYCDSKEGGCDKIFAVTIVLNPSVTIYKLVKGEDDGRA